MWPHSGSGEAGNGTRGIRVLAMSRPTLSPLLGVSHVGDCYKATGLSMGLKTLSDC